MRRNEWRISTGTAVLLLLMAGTAAAQDTGPRINLHGFGEWSYIRTNGNEYLGGTDEGEADNVSFGLNVSTEVNDKLSLVGQLAVRSRLRDEPNAELDYAFAQWKVSDALQLRLGRSKHPFGIYTEIFDIGTLRPFFQLPLSLYGPSEIAAQSYDGIGLTGNHENKGGSSWDYDLYAGEISFAGSQRVEGNDQTDTEQVRNVLGGRARFHTTIDGLSFGASGYTGARENPEDPSDKPRHVGLGLHAEYAMLPLTLRAEIGSHNEGDEHTRAFYLEGAYRIREKWELAARYDHFAIRADTAGEESPDHRDVSLGLNYWFNSQFVLKLSLHNVQGLAAVTPENEADADEHTSAIVFGSQFTF
jgi:hypothetical protein